MDGKPNFSQLDSYTIQFITSVRRVLNRHAVVSALIWAALAGMVSATLIAACFTLRGYRVEPVWLLVALGSAATVFLFSYFRNRSSVSAAAGFADEFFSLSDGLKSSIEFRDGKGGFERLAMEWTDSACAGKKTSDIPRPETRRRLLLIAMFAALTVLMISLDDSPEVSRRLRDGEASLALTAELDEALKRQLAELEKSGDGEMAREFDKSGIKEDIEALAARRDRKEAAKEYARIERRLDKMLENAKFAEDKAMLAEIAKELAKKQSMRSLSRALSDKKFKQAAGELKDMNPSATPKGEKFASDRLRKLKDLMDRLKAAVERAGQGGRFGKQAQKMCQSMSDATPGLERMVSGENGDMDESVNKLGSEMDAMCDALRNHGAKCSFMAKMEALRKQLSQAQSKALGQMAMMMSGAGNPSPGMGDNNGQDAAMGVGTGSDDSRNHEIDADPESGSLTALTGKKGSGPSNRAVEEAASGRGVAGSARRRLDSDYKRQFESFISRDDIPPSMKSGVKKYFQIIHGE